ncbi:hypothetical protein SUGI_0181250 [Cryptomeria japonica]|nr:hypothetical protein SUGI_0181250 [Cryptomeria japonica]
MITRDACFVLQVLESCGETSMSNGIFSRGRHDPEIVKDVLKRENQLPFWALKEISTNIEDWFESALKNLSPIEVADVGNRQ